LEKYCSILRRNSFSPKKEESIVTKLIVVGNMSKQVCLSTEIASSKVLQVADEQRMHSSGALVAVQQNRVIGIQEHDLHFNAFAL
jgi:hypothetical protein